MARIDAGICERLITAATSHCTAATPLPPPVIQTVHEPNWEGVTASLSALSTAFVLGSIVVALLAVIGGFAWARIIASSAEEEARKVAKEIAEGVARENVATVINAWLRDEAPKIIREHLDLLTNLGGGSAPPNPAGGGNEPAHTAVDAIGEAAGDGT